MIKTVSKRDHVSAGLSPAGRDGVPLPHAAGAGTQSEDQTTNGGMLPMLAFAAVLAIAGAVGPTAVLAARRFNLRGCR